MSLASKLKLLRAENHMTQQMLAERLNVARTTITGYETKNRQPSHEKLNDIADIFGVTVDYLIDDREPEPLEDSPSVSISPLMDQRVAKLFGSLSHRSQQEALRYMRLLDLWERLHKRRPKMR